MLICFMCASSIAGDDTEALSSSLVVHPESECTSVVCNKVVEPESVNKAGKFPEREKNEVQSALGSAIFVAGEIGLAENLQEAEPEPSDVD